MEYSILFSFFLIFSGSALLATGALYTRQPIIVAYFLAGIIFGPSGFKFITNLDWMNDLSHIGIIFLLFLLGLDMQPQNLSHLLKKTFIVGVVSSLFFAFVGYCIGKLFGIDDVSALILGASMMFSSTIIGIKLLPTTVLHHRHTGELIVSILLLQDLIAIILLLLLYNFDSSRLSWHLNLTIAFAALPLIFVLAFISVKYILLNLIKKFDQYRDFLFLLALGWCMGMAFIANLMNLSWEIGAFIAGISIATSPISQFIALNLKPLRDFFLVLFFFSIGAGFDLQLLMNQKLLAIVLLSTCLVLALKPIVFRFFLRKVSETKQSAWEVGFRLAQTSEFSILIAFVTCSHNIIDSLICHAIQATAIITMIASSYITVFFFESPLAIKDELRRD
jgi:Kef-type K+ transport system membrane component KefB